MYWLELLNFNLEITQFILSVESVSLITSCWIIGCFCDMGENMTSIRDTVSALWGMESESTGGTFVVGQSEIVSALLLVEFYVCCEMICLLKKLIFCSLGCWVASNSSFCFYVDGFEFKAVIVTLPLSLKPSLSRGKYLTKAEYHWK
jgi:hypothetical protein